MSQWGICADSQTLKACLFFLIISSFIYALIYRIWRSRRVFTAQLVSVIETVGEGITLSDRAGKFVIFNSEIQQITGYTIEEVNNHEDFATLVQLKFQVSGQISAIAEVLQSTNRNIGATIQAKDGTHKTLLISTSLMRHQNQNLFLSVYRDISDRYQVQEHLRLLESAVVNANDAILITSSEPITESGPSIIYVNNAFTRMTGYSQEEVIGKTPRILQSTKTERSQLDKIRAALTAWQPVRAELINCRKDGTEFWVELNIVPVADEKGWFTHWVSVQRDITERKEVEAALYKSQQQCKLAVTAGKMGLWNWDLKTKEIYLDPNLQSMMGYDTSVNQDYQPHSSATLYQSTDRSKNYVNSWSQLVYPDDLEQVMVAVNDHLNGSAPGFEVEYRMLHQDGIVRWVYARGMAIRNDKGEADHMMGINTDITERKQTEVALQESETRFRQIFAEAPIGIALSYPDGHLYQVNQAFCKMLEYSEPELSTLNLQEITYPADLEAEQPYIQQLLQGEISIYQLEKRYFKKNQDLLWTQVTRGVVRDLDNQRIHQLDMIRDITERRQIEKMTDDFVSIVSHELRTPLTSLRAALGLLLTGKLGKLHAQGQRLLEFAVTDTDLLVRLVTDILDLERLKSGTLTLAPQICLTADLIQQAVQIMQPIATEAQISLVVNVVEAPLWIDRDHIVQTLTNLIGNAIKFSPAGSTIGLSAEQQGNQTIFQVKDQGRGIPKDKLEIIFERFQQVDASDSRQRGGNGLGLAICRSIVQQNGGKIWAESVVGVGSTFYFTLPLPPEELIPLDK